MKTRLYKKEDYLILEQFWKTHKDWDNTAIPEFILPPLGIIVEENNAIICAGFIYESKNDQCAWTGWLVSDPNSDKILRDQALTLLLDTIVEHSKKAGHKFLFTSARFIKLIERLEKAGFKRADERMTNMVQFF
jgi:hypothetical protein